MMYPKSLRAIKTVISFENFIKKFFLRTEFSIFKANLYGKPKNSAGSDFAVICPFEPLLHSFFYKNVLSPDLR